MANPSANPYVSKIELAPVYLGEDGSLCPAPEAMWWTVPIDAVIPIADAHLLPAGLDGTAWRPESDQQWRWRSDWWELLRLDAATAVMVAEELDGDSLDAEDVCVVAAVLRAIRAGATLDRRAVIDLFEKAKA